MKIEYTPYFLEGSTTRREGALLKFSFKEDLIGFADCHPWECMGQASLKDQLASIQQGNLTPLIRRSQTFARLDAEARFNRKSLFDGLSIPPSNYLMMSLQDFDRSEIDRHVKLGFDRFKIKMGCHLDSEVSELEKLLSLLPSHCKARLDFGSRLLRLEFEAFLRHFKALSKTIDYFEDPFPFDPKAWEEVQSLHSVSLACDYESEKALAYPKSARVLIIKPAVQEVEPFLAPHDSRKLVITSYLDHPIGTLGAAYCAALVKKSHPDRLLTCGLLTHHVYKPNDFSKQLKCSEAMLIPLKGIGIGFSEELYNLDWQPLRGSAS